MRITTIWRLRGKEPLRLWPLSLLLLLCLADARTAGRAAGQSSPPSSNQPTGSAPATHGADSPGRTEKDLRLPTQTSRYNRGGFPGRYRDANGKGMLFQLRHKVSVFDGAGREIGRARQPVMLNSGTTKEMDVDGKGGPEAYVWGWRTEGGSGWVPRSALVNPPPADSDPQRNPKPPREAEIPLTIDSAAGRKKLEGLRHVNSEGVIPPTGGNKGEHYAGRNPGPKDFIYLLFAVPNVKRGGMAKDSIPNGGKFIPALDEKDRPIKEVMTMYRDRDLKKPVLVTFLYGRVPGSDRYGWIARANVGDL